MNSLPVRSAPKILNSWKEISSYLGRGVRTVQRWEEDLHLPVHRVGTGRRAPVFAFEDELRFWLRATKMSETRAGRLADARGPRADHSAAIHKAAGLAHRLIAATHENRRLMDLLANKLTEMRRGRGAGDQRHFIRFGKPAPPPSRVSNQETKPATLVS